MLTEYIRHVINTLNIAEDMPTAEGGLLHVPPRIMIWIGSLFCHSTLIKKHTEEEEGKINRVKQKEEEMKIERDTKNWGNGKCHRASCRWGFGGLC